MVVAGGVGVCVGVSGGVWVCVRPGQARGSWFFFVVNDDFEFFY